MAVKETVGAIIVVVFGLMIFFGIQFLSSTGVVGGTNILLSYVGIGLILVGIALIIWLVKSILD